MQNSLLQNTVLPGEPTRPSSRRLRIFFVFFSISGALGMAYNFMRPAVYRSTATVLVTPRAPLDETADASAVSAVAVQRHVISHPSVISQAYRRFQDAAQVEMHFELADLESMLSAVVIVDTNILELRAEGRNRTELAPLIDAWIDAFLAAQAPTKKVSSQSANEALQQQLRELDGKVQTKRDQLAKFRQQHDIASLQREENQVLVRLKGLTESLNKSEEVEISAQAQVASMKASVAEGKQIPLDSKHLVEMETRAAELQGLMAGLEGIYTAEYLENDESYTDMRQQRELLHATIEAEYADQLQRKLTQAEIAHDTAQRATALIQQQLDEHEQKAANFTTRFAAHEALLEDLAQLEKFHRQLQQRTLHSEVLRDALPPEISVQQRASIPQRPIRPAYRRDAIICLGGALLLGLSAVLLDMFLTAPIHPATMSESRTVFLPWSEAQAFIESKLQQVTAVTTPARALEFRSPRELSRDDVTRLLRFGEGAAPSLVGGLVSGLTGSEIGRLCWSHLDLDESLIRVPGEESRILPLAPAATQMLAQWAPPAAQPSAPVWSNGHGVPLTSAAIDSLIVSAAYVAGLDAPTEVNAETLRFTYIAYLVRQGLPLDQLPGLVGQITPAAMSHCGLLSPSGPGITIENLQRVYPAIESWSKIT